MKKWIFFLFASMLLCSCSCLLSQIPPQHIYAGSGCKAILPDYKTQVSVTGGCTGFAITQVPSPGTELNSVNRTANVIIKATGANGKSSQIQFEVTMIDTITPVITPIGDLIIAREFQLNMIQDAADKIAISMFKYQSGPTIEDKLLVTISRLDTAINERERVTRLATTVEIDRDSMVDWDKLRNIPSFLRYSDLDAIASYAASKIRWVVWDSVKNVPAAVKHAVDWRDFYDWLAFLDYNPVPKRQLSILDLTKVKTPAEFTPLIFDKTDKKFKFYEDNAWHAILSE